jgi:Ca2+-binding RTX toxin-like protein
MFHKGSAAHDANDRVIYNPKNGALSYDPDGIGAAHAVKIAPLPKKLKGISYHDFFVV